jgi:hypothetical protein
MKVGHKNFSTPRSIEKIDQVDATKSDSAESRLPSVSAIFTIFGTASFQALNDHVKMPVPQQFLPITQGPNLIILKRYEEFRKLGRPISVKMDRIRCRMLFSIIGYHGELQKSKMQKSFILHCRGETPDPKLNYRLLCQTRSSRLYVVCSWLLNFGPGFRQNWISVTPTW